MPITKPRRNRSMITIDTTVDVYVDDILGDAGDDQIKAEYEARFGSAPGMPSFDLVAEISAELCSGRLNAAIALCDSFLNAARIDDAKRQAAYQAAGRAH
jgi:hypothetical protein